MERVFYLHSPRIMDIQIMKKGDVRRAKLYYLRGVTGKAAKVQEKIGGGRKSRLKTNTEKLDISDENSKIDTGVNANEHISETVENSTQG